MRSKGQVTIFIVLAVLIVAAVGGYFLLRGSFGAMSMPASIEPVYLDFLSCLEEDALSGIDILGTQGGYIELPSFEPGSQYAPFSNQLDFLGNAVPYWYYVSGNGLEKEQVPTKNEMEEELAVFVEERARDCLFDIYYDQGYEISQGEPEVNVDIDEGIVNVNLDMDFVVNFGDDSVQVNKHQIKVDSNLGRLYDAAKKVYDKEQKEFFLEMYAVDNLRLYAPVDGVEISCAPQIWNTRDVFEELQQAIEANTLALRTKGNDYSLADDKNKYFVIEEDFGASVNFINSKDWPYLYEVEPSEGNLLVSLPVGNQPGLGILGFCYVPYHFVYDVKYPVLIQTSIEDEIFQFPMAVVLDNNYPRKPLNFQATDSNVVDFCNYKNTELEVRTYNSNLDSIDAEISFECFGTRCDIGETENGILEESFPQCVNGFVVAKAEGYKTQREMFSTTSSGMIEIILDKVYEKDVSLKLGGSDYNEESIITFSSDKDSQTIIYPEQKKVNLMEGQYEVRVQIYDDADISFPATENEHCVDVPQSGVGGLFGLTSEKCYTIEVPRQTISTVLVGGGTENYYILESELKNNDLVEIGAGMIAKPTNTAELQVSYALYEQKGLEINFK
jgi:hypothetical protein